MSNGKRTPGPWHFSGESYVADHGREYEVTTEEGRGIWTAKTQFAEDARFIVCAVNSHDAFLTGLRAVEQLASEYEVEAERLSFDRARQARGAAQSMRAVVAEAFARANRELAK